MGRSTSGVLEMATKRSLFDKRDEGSRRHRVRLEYRNGTMLKNMLGDHLGPCPRPESEIRRPRAQTGERPSSRLR